MERGTRVFGVSSSIFEFSRACGSIGVDLKLRKFLPKVSRIFSKCLKTLKLLFSNSCVNSSFNIANIHAPRSLPQWKITSWKYARHWKNLENVGPPCRIRHDRETRLPVSLGTHETTMRYIQLWYVDTPSSNLITSRLSPLSWFSHYIGISFSTRKRKEKKNKRKNSERIFDNRKQDKLST